MMAQPIAYQLLMRPTPLTSLILTGNFTPGSGNGFDRTNVQIVAPIGRGSDIQFATTSTGRTNAAGEQEHLLPPDDRRLLRSPDRVQPGSQDGHRHLDILAFPSQAVNFGVGRQNGSIVPQSFADDQFFGQWP